MLWLQRLICRRRHCPCCCITDEKVKAAKEHLAEALADSDTAWIGYISNYGAGSVMGLIAGPRTKHLTETERATSFKKNFKDALHIMDKMNKDAEAEGNDNVAFGINSHAHLSHEDFMELRASGVRGEPLQISTVRKARRTGPRPVALKRRSAKLNPVGVATQATECTPSSGNVPYTLGTTKASTAIDWVAKGFVTPVKDQFQCGSCTAFGTTVVTEWVLLSLAAAVALGPIRIDGEDRYFTNANAILSEDDLMECEGGNALVERFHAVALTLIIPFAQALSKPWTIWMNVSSAGFW
jgi:hypothetical protein